MLYPPKIALQKVDLPKSDGHSIELEWHTLLVDIKHVLAITETALEVSDALEGRTCSKSLVHQDHLIKG